MTQAPGRIYRWLAESVKRGGSQRALYTAESTLSRRGLLTRADKRARELAGLGLGPGDVIAVSLGNVSDYLVALMGASKLGAVTIPVDPSNGDRSLLRAMERIRVRAVIRRQRGLEGAPLEYPEGYRLESRRQLSAAMVAIDIVSPPQRIESPPEGTELIFGVVGSDDVVRDVHRAAEQLEAIGRAAAHALTLREKTRLVCVQALTQPGFFDPVVLGWLASDAQLVIAGGPGLDCALPMAAGAERIIAVDTTHNFLALARALKVSNRTLELLPILPGPSASTLPGRLCKQRFGSEPRGLLQLEEVGILGARDLRNGAVFDPCPAVEVQRGANGEILARSAQTGRVIPAPGPETTGAEIDGWTHTGFTGAFTKDGQLKEATGRLDTLVRLEGRRACLDRISSAMCKHPRVTWARPRIETDGHGVPVLTLLYYATGQTEVEDIEEHAVGELEPFMVPRVFDRQASVPE